MTPQPLYFPRGGVPSYISVPNDWGANLKAKLATKAVVGIMGDSVSQGYYASNLETTSWRGLVTAYLQSKYGNGGSGFMPASQSAAFANAAGIPSTARDAYLANGNYYATTGSWSNYFGVEYGPGHAAVSAGSGATIQGTVTGTTALIWTIGGNGGWTYQIDGGTAVAGTTGAYGAQKQTISGLSAGSHTVKLNVTSGTVYFVGMSGENATGVVVNNFSIYGGQASYYNNTETTIKNGRWSGGSLNPVDCLIYSMGLNEAAANAVSSRTLSRTIRTTLDDVMDGSGGNAGATDLMLVTEHVGNYDTNRIYQDHAVMIQGLAQDYGGTCVNMWAQGGGSYAEWSAQNMWGNAVTVGASGSDAVHLSDAGHNNVGNGVKLALAQAGI